MECNKTAAVCTTAAVVVSWVPLEAIVSVLFHAGPQPAVPVRDIPARQSKEFILQALGHRTARACADIDVIYRTDRGNL